MTEESATVNVGSPKNTKRRHWLAKATATLASVALIAGALAMGGAQPQASASSWLNGLQGLRDNQLWAFRDGLDENLHGWIDPGDISAANWVSKLTDYIDPDGLSNGDSCGSGVELNTGAVGPIFVNEGDNALYAVSWDGAFSTPISCVVSASGSGNVAFIDGGYGPSWGGEINQATGELYIKRNGSPASSSVTYLRGDGTSAGDYGDSGSAWLTSALWTINTFVKGPRQSIISDQVARSDSVVVMPGGLTLNQNALNHGAPAAAQWVVASDLLIDANGNIFTIAQNGNYHQLVKVYVPRDNQGAPQSGTWYYEAVSWLGNFSDVADIGTNMEGLAFIDDSLYVLYASGRMLRVNPVSGAHENLGKITGNHDLGSSQVIPVIEGVIFNDLDANGMQNGSEVGVPNVEVEVWTKGSSGNFENQGSVTTGPLGNYSVIIPEDDDDVYLRIKQPTIDGVNARQTYASAGTFVDSKTNKTNTVTALCNTSSGDYKPLTSPGGACNGARHDDIDPNTITGTPTSATGGAAIVSKITMKTATAVVTANFGIHASGSWGDAPARSTNAVNGPYGYSTLNGNTLYLGTAYPGDGSHSTYSDGVANGSNLHAATDDGLEVSPAGQDAWVGAQGYLFAVGASYDFRAKVAGSMYEKYLASAPGSTIPYVGVWMTPISGGIADTTFSKVVLTGTPDVDGYARGTLVFPTTTPSGGSQPVYVRARVGLEQAKTTADGRGVSDTAANSWAPLGEVEDYEGVVATNVIRLQARTLGGVSSRFGISATNISSSSPSSPTDSLLTNSAGTYVPSTTPHVVQDSTKDASFTTTGAGASGSNSMNGWQVSAAGTYCENSATGAPVAYELVGQGLRVKASALTTSNSDITCFITYGPAALDLSASGIWVTPAANALVNKDAYTVKVLATGSVVDENGATKQVNAAGSQITLTLEPVSGGATTTGAAFFDGSTDKGQTITCTLDANGECALTIKGSVAGLYRVAAGIDANSNSTIDSGEAFAGFPNNATGTDSAGNSVTKYKASPVSINFKAGDPTQGSIELDNTLTRYADTGLGLLGQPARDAGYGEYIDTKAQPGDDYHILYVYLSDGTGSPVDGMEDGGDNSGKINLACGAASPAAGKCAAAGITFGSIEATGTPGKYAVKVYATQASTQRISVSVDSITGGALLDKNNASNHYVNATFSPMTVPFDANSSLTIACDGSEVANYVSPSKPGDYCVGTIVIKDINGSGITGATSYLTPGTQASGDAASVYFRDLAEDTSTDSDGNPSNPGHYKFKVHADVAGSYPINFTYAFGSDLAYTKNGNVPAVFGQPTVDTNKSTHVLNNTADKIANNSDTYTGTITLLSSNDAPVRDGVAQLALAVDPASGYTLSAITCTTVSGKCSGVYTYTIKAAKVGTYEITPTYATGGAAKTLTAQDATFIVTPAQADPASSVFVLGSSTIIEVPSGQPVDVEVATPAQATAQTASVDEGPGYSFHVNVKVWDAGQQNAVPGVTVKAELSGANCDGSAQFETTGGKTASAPSLSDGVAEFTVTSSIATNCTVSVNIVKGGSDEAVAGSVKTLTWVDSTVSLANSYYTVTPATAANAIVADNTETGTIKVTLRDANNFPVTSQAANLTTLPEAGSRITVGNFIHLGNGVYEATWTGKKAGAFDMGVNLSGTALSVQNPSGNGKAYLKPGQPSIVDPFDCDPSDPKTAQGSNLSASPTLVPVDGVSTVKVLITDYYCNPVIDPVVVTFTTDNGQLSASTNSTDANGVSTVTLTDNIARIDTVSASAGGQSVKNATTGTPGLEVEFTATAADPASSLLEAVTSGDKIVGGVEKHAAKATVRDGSSGHNPLPGRAVTFTYRYTDLDGTLRTGTFTADTDASGVATYEFGSNVATVWTITAAIPSGQIPPDAGLQFNFVAGAPDINKSLASFTVGKETVRADGIAQVPAQMKIQDSFGNMISGQSCGFFVTYAGTEGAQFPGGVKALASVGPTGADGVCSTYLTSYYPGAFPVSGTFASVDTPDSQDANFSNLAVDRGTSFWSVAPTAGNSKNPAVSNDNDSYTVTIHLRDANDSPLNKESVTIGYKLTPDGTEQTMTVTSVAPNGVATGFIKTKVAGIYDVRVLTGGDPISTTPGGSTYTQQVTFQAGAPDPIKTAATWQHSTGRVENNGTATHYGTLTVLDAFGNKVPNVTVTFELSHDRNAHFTTTANSGDNIGQGPTNLRSDANGVVTVYVASTSAEVTQINATLVTIGVGTAAFQFGPGAPDVSKSTFVITPTGTRTADGVEAFTGVVTVRDSSGIVVGGYPVSFSVPANVHVMETGPFMTDAITGQVTVHFTSTVSNTYTVNALMASAPVPAADGTTIDQTITFVAGPIDLNVSTYDVTTGKVYADGVATHTGTFVARDAQGNVISGVDVEFNIDEGAAAVPGPVLKFGSGTPSATVTGSTNASGVAQISITSNEPGTFESTAKVGGQPVRGFADLLHRNRAAQFTAGDADTLKSSRNIAPDTDAYPNASVASDGVEQFAITVTVASAKNILVDGAEVRIAGLDSAVTLVEGNATQTTGAANSSTYGTFTWHATSTTSGSFTAYVQVKVGTDWLTVGAPVKLNFAPGEGYPANSWLVEPDPTTKAVADNNATLPVSAYVFDINGNAVTTGTVTFTIPANTTVGSVTGATTVPVAINNGVATINVKSTVAATHQITASQSAGQIMNIKRPTGGGVVASDGIARVTFTHGTADPATSLLSVPTAAGDVTKLADGVDAHTAQVVVRDANTNLVLSGTVTFYYSYTDFAGAQHTGNSGERTIDPGTGIATWDFTSTVAKPWTITATIGGVGGNVNPAPGVVAGFRAGLPDATRTVASLQVGKDSAKADGQANVPAWMIVQDTFGNPVAGYKCGFELTDASDPGAAKFDNASTGAFTKADVGPTSGDGKCAVEIKSFFSGHFPVRGVFDGVKTLNPLPEALFNNQAVSAANSWWSVAADSGNSTTPATANDSDFYLVTVNLRDEDSAIVNNESVDVYYKLTPSSAEQKLTVVSGANGNPAGTATASIKTKAAGIYDVRVSKASNAIATTAGGTTFVQQIEFIAGAPDGTKSFLTSPVGTAKANGQAVQIITATVKDVNGNLIKNRAVQFVIPTGVKSGTTSGQTTVSVNTDNNGVATLPLTSTTPNTYSVTATVLGVAIVSGSPATATFINDDLSLANSTLVLTTSGVLEVRTGFHNVKATLVDAQGNVFTQVREVTFYAKAPGGSLWELLGTANTIDGVADYTFTKIKAGTWQVRAEVTSNSPTGKIGTGADGTVVFPEFKAGPADSIKTAATWTGSRGKVLSNDTDTHYAQVTVLDRDENPVSGVNITFTLSSTHAAHFVDGNGVGLGKTIAPASGPDGVIRVLIASPADEVVPITATLHGVSVVASAGPSTFEFGPDAPNAANSTFAVSPAVGSTKIANGSDAFTGVVTVHDANGLPVGNYTVNFDLPADVALVETAPSAFETDANGQITVHFVSTKAGTYTVNALVGSDHVPTVDRQIEFVAGPIDFNKSYIEVVANGAVANGTATDEMSVHLYDHYDNPVLDGYISFTLPGNVSPVGPAAAVGPSANSGEVVLQVTSTVADEYQIGASVRRGLTGNFDPITMVKSSSGGLASGTTVPVTFVAGAPVAANSVLTVTEAGPMVANNADYYTANVELKDAYSNTVKIAGNSVHFTFSLPGSSVPNVETDALTGANGMASYQFSTAKAGSWSVAGLYGGDEVSNSPRDLVFVAGPFDAAASTFDVTGGKAASDGHDEHRAWAVVTDAQGNPISGVDVMFTIDAGASSVAGPFFSDTQGMPGTLNQLIVRSNADGLAEVFIVSQEPGTFPVTASVNGVTITGNAVTPLNREAQFTSGDPDASKSSRAITPDTDTDPTITIKADNTETYAITVSVRSVFNALVENARVRLVLPSGTPVTLVEGSGETTDLTTGMPGSTDANRAYGQFTWHAKTTKVGSYTGQVQVRVGTDWQDVGAPVLLNFVAGDPSVGPFSCDAGQTGTSFKFAPSYLYANELATGTVKVTDQFCNPIDGAHVTFNTSHGTFDPASGVVTTGPDGTATITLTDTVAHVDTASATVAGLPIAVTGTENVHDTPATTQAVEFYAPPTAPVVDPSNGTQVTGEADPGTEVTVTDEDGNPIEGCVHISVGADGHFSCTPKEKIPDGTEVSVTATDPSGRVSPPTKITIGAISMTLDPPTLYRTEDLKLHGFNFIPGESVTVVLNSTNPVTIGTFIADANGQVTIPAWQVPNGFELGAHTATLTGNKSGPISASFTVLERVVASTGGATTGTTGGAGTGSLSVSVVLLAIAATVSKRKLG